MLIVPLIAVPRQVSANSSTAAILNALLLQSRTLTSSGRGTATVTPLLTISRFLSATAVALVTAVRRAGGTASGSWSESGSASGLVQRRGTANGSWTESSDILGIVLRIGSASGEWEIIGLASSSTVHAGETTGDVVWTITVSGVTPPLEHFGSAVGFWTFSGTAFGLAPHVEVTFVLGTPLLTRRTEIDSMTTRETVVRSSQTRSTEVDRIRERSAEYEPLRQRILVARMED